jgi:RNA polymerase sigma-70 factor (ECF subfamily)
MERSQLDEVRALYREHRPLLFSLAYRMLGIVSDAEDVVQDVFSHLNDVNLSSIANKKAYLCKMITNRCLDVLKSARKKRETYVGHWLPEPLPCDLREGGEDPQQSMVHREMVSYAVLALLQQLNPVERAVFFLREAFAFDYGEIASMLNKTAANCRKIHSRAKAKIAMEQSRRLHEPENTDAVVTAFLKAARSGEVEPFARLLAEDAVLYSDGGGRVPAAIRPIETRERILRFLFGLVRKAEEMALSLEMRPIRINGETGVIIRNQEEIFGIMAFQLRGGRAASVFLLRNPEKLKPLSRN